MLYNLTSIRRFYNKCLLFYLANSDFFIIIAYIIYVIIYILSIICTFPIDESYIFIKEDNPWSSNGESFSGGNSPNPQGSPNPQDNLGVHAAGGGLQRDESSNTLGSNTSHTVQEYAEAKASELLNVSNIMDSTTMSNEEKKEEVLKAFSKLSNEAIAKDAQISKLKGAGEIKIKLEEIHKN